MILELRLERERRLTLRQVREYVTGQARVRRCIPPRPFIATIEEDERGDWRIRANVREITKATGS